MRLYGEKAKRCLQVIGALESLNKISDLTTNDDVRNLVRSLKDKYFAELGNLLNNDNLSIPFILSIESGMLMLDVEIEKEE